MTWFWFVLLGIIALVARASIASWVSNWNDDSLKHMSTIGLIGFGIMATFGIAISADVWPLHIGAALGGIMGFFAISEFTGRKARTASLQALERGRRLKPDQRDSGKQQPGDPKMRWQNYKQSEPEPVVRMVEPPLITDQDSPTHILEMLERASEQWQNPEADEPRPTQQEPEPASYQSITQIIARASEQKEVIEGAVEVIHVPVTQAAQDPPAAEKKEEAAGTVEVTHIPFTEADDEQPEDDGHYQPGDVKLAGTPVMKAAQTLSQDSAIARKSGPVKLGRSLPLRPPGPLSLGSTKPGPVPIEERAKTGSFHYEPKMVRSRLGKKKPASNKEAPEKAAEDSAQPEEQAASPAPAAELQ